MWGWLILIGVFVYALIAVIAGVKWQEREGDRTMHDYCVMVGLLFFVMFTPVLGLISLFAFIFNAPWSLLSLVATIAVFFIGIVLIALSFFVFKAPETSYSNDYDGGAAWGHWERTDHYNEHGHHAGHSDTYKKD